MAGCPFGAELAMGRSRDAGMQVNAGSFLEN
jgi:hypothetical protein